MDDMDLSRRIAESRRELAEVFDLRHIEFKAPDSAGRVGQMYGIGAEGNAAAKAYNLLADWHAEIHKVKQ